MELETHDAEISRPWTPEAARFCPGQPAAPGGFEARHVRPASFPLRRPARSGVPRSAIKARGQLDLVYLVQEGKAA
jgi:hypothetical protein